MRFKINHYGHLGSIRDDACIHVHFFFLDLNTSCQRGNLRQAHLKGGEDWIKIIDAILFRTKTNWKIGVLMGRTWHPHLSGVTGQGNTAVPSSLTARSSGKRTTITIALGRTVYLCWYNSYLWSCRFTGYCTDLSHYFRHDTLDDMFFQRSSCLQIS
jgi:hypothetical protein